MEISRKNSESFINKICNGTRLEIIGTLTDRKAHIADYILKSAKKQVKTPLELTKGVFQLTRKLNFSLQ